MPRPLNNYTTTDAYNPNGEIVFTSRVNTFQIIVTGAAIYYQFAVNPPGGYPGTAPYVTNEAFIPPGRYTFDETDSHSNGGDGSFSACHVRSGKAGTPAQVSIQG